MSDSEYSTEGSESQVPEVRCREDMNYGGLTGMVNPIYNRSDFNMSRNRKREYSSLQTLMKDFKSLVERSDDKWCASINCYGKSYHLDFSSNRCLGGLGAGFCGVGDDDSYYSMEAVVVDIDYLNGFKYNPTFSVHSNGDRISMKVALSSNDTYDDCFEEWKYELGQYRQSALTMFSMGSVMTGFMIFWKYIGLSYYLQYQY